MTSSLRLASLALAGALCAAAQQSARPPMPGVPAVKGPMSYLIPDGQYSIEANGTVGGPDWLAITDDSVWTNSKGTDMVFRMDPRSNAVTAFVPVKKPCSGFAVAA